MREPPGWQRHQCIVRMAHPDSMGTEASVLETLLDLTRPCVPTSSPGYSPVSCITKWKLQGQCFPELDESFQGLNELKFVSQLEVQEVWGPRLQLASEMGTVLLGSCPSLWGLHSLRGGSGWMTLVVKHPADVSEGLLESTPTPV